MEGPGQDSSWKISHPLGKYPRIIPPYSSWIILDVLTCLNAKALPMVKSHKGSMQYYLYFPKGTSYGRDGLIKFEAGSFNWKSKVPVSFQRFKSD